MSGLPRMRTIKKCVEHFKNEDPETSVNEYQIRQIVRNNSYIAVKSGTKFLVDLDKLIDFFACGGGEEEEQEPIVKESEKVIKIRESRIRAVPE